MNAQAAAGSFEPVMNEQDEAMWLLEDDPVMRSTITAIAILDRHPDMGRLKERLIEASTLVPRLRQRVVEQPLGLGPPRWVDAGSPDLHYHLRHLRAPLHATLDEALRIAEPLAMNGFDRARPLWEFTVIDGLPDGQSALVQKVHHSLADGIAAVEFAQLLYDRTRDPKKAGARIGPVAEPSPATAKLGAPQRLASAVTSAAKTAAFAARYPVLTAKGLAATTASLGRLVAPAPSRLSPMFKGHGLSWQFDMFDTPLAAWRDVARATGGTINDVFLAVVAGGVRRYHEQAGFNTDAVRLTLPVNIRAAGDPMGGNHFTPLRFVLPINERDPATRIVELGALSRQWRSEPALRFTERIAALFNRLPRPLAVPILASLFKSTDVVATNVPAFPFPVFLAGAKITRLYAFAPTSGSAANIAFVSHVDRACIGITSDTTAVANPAALKAALVEATNEVLAIAAPAAQVAS